MSTTWQGYLLDKTWVDELHTQDVGLNTLMHHDITQHAVLGPIEVQGIGHYKARKALFAELKKRGIPDEVKFMHLYSYLYIKNEVDDRTSTSPKPDLTVAFQALQRVQEAG